MTSVPLDVPCPVCGEKKLEYHVERLDVPHFGECLQTTLICQKCNYRSTDTLIVGQKEPLHYEVRIDSERDMLIRVIRSTSGTIRIPELGVTVEPTPLSEAFVSNVEGVLERIEAVLGQAVQGAETEGQRMLGKKLLEAVERIKSGRQAATLIIDDPFGNSAIISEKVEKRKLTEEEIKKLKTGMFVFEKSETTG